MLDDSLNEAIKYIQSHIDAGLNFYCASIFLMM